MWQSLYVSIYRVNSGGRFLALGPGADLGPGSEACLYGRTGTYVPRWI